MNDQKLICSKTELMDPEIVVKPQKVADQLENISQMLITTSKLIEKNMRETGFDGYAIVACPIIMICPNKK